MPKTSQPVKLWNISKDVMASPQMGHKRHFPSPENTVEAGQRPKEPETSPKISEHSHHRNNITSDVD